jgi:peptidyl-tRNA hydrolase
MPSSKSLMADFVLEPFPTNERPLANAMIKRAADACSLVITSGLAHAMTIYNTTLKAE